MLALVHGSHAPTIRTVSRMGNTILPEDTALLDFLTDAKIPVGKAAKSVFDWLQDNGEWLFDAIAAGLESLIDGILAVLQAPPPLLLIALLCALAWALQRSWQTCLLVALGFLYVVGGALSKWREYTAGRAQIADLKEYFIMGMILTVFLVILVTYAFQVIGQT